MLVSRQIVVAGPGGKDLGYWESPGKGERYGRLHATALFTMTQEIYYAWQPFTRPVPNLDANDPAEDEDIEINL